MSAMPPRSKPPLLTQAREPNGSLIVMPDTFTTVHRAKIAAMAAEHGLPAVYPFRFFAASGGLVSYGSDTADNYRRLRQLTPTASFKAEGNRSTFPFRRRSNSSWSINLKAAKRLNLLVPTSAAHPWQMN